MSLPKSDINKFGENLSNRFRDIQTKPSKTVYFSAVAF